MSVNLAEDLVDISSADMEQLSDDIERTGRPKLVTKGGIGNLVVLSVGDYEAMQESLEVAAGLLRGEHAVSEGRVRPNAEVQQRLKERMAAAVRQRG